MVPRQRSLLVTSHSNQDREVSWSPYGFRERSLSIHPRFRVRQRSLSVTLDFKIQFKFISCQVGQVFTVFLFQNNKTLVLYMFQDFRFQGQVIFDKLTSIKSWPLKSVSFVYIDICLASFVNEGHSIDTRFCTHNLILEDVQSDHSYT